MPRYIAFLRAINVGGHNNVRMDHLRRLFGEMGFTGVETFIASGNVVFESASTDAAALELTIAAGLRTALGYAVATFIRTGTELAEIARHQPFPDSELAAAAALNIAFLADPLDEGAILRLQALKTDVDDFRVHRREVYWLCRRKQSESTFSNAVLEKTTGRPSTLRGAATVRKMAAKYALLES